MKANWSTVGSMKALARRFLMTFKPPERISCSTWAEKYRRLSPEASSKGGAFSFYYAPWQREPMDQPDNPEVAMTVMVWPSQTAGKTETVNNLIGKKIDIDPCPILMLQPTLEMSETWSKDRGSTMLRDTPRLRGKVKEARTRDSGNTLLHKRFPGGHLTIAGANSPASLASRPIRMVICDEVDRYPASAGTEGDPVALAEKRTESFPDASIVLVSTPTIEGLSRIEKAFKESDQRYWFCPCPVCGAHQTLKWGQVKWDNDDPKTARYECELKGCVWDDAMRQKAVRTGEWRPTAPFNAVRGYHLNGIVCLFEPKKPFKTRLVQMVSDFLRAKGNGEQTHKVWINTFLAETWKVKGLEVKPHEIAKRAKPWNGTLHPRCLVITVGVDIQADRIEAEFTGYGEGHESWGLGYHIFSGDTNRDEPWAALDMVLETEFAHPCGMKVKAAMTFIDLGFRPQRVVAFTRKREARNIHACAGNKTPWSVLCSRPTRTTSRKAVKFQVGGDAAKEELFARLAVDEEGPGYCHFPVGYNYDHEYFRQLTAEKLVIEHNELGMIKKKHFVKQRERNEALDIRCYGRAALEYLNPNWKLLGERMAVKETSTEGGQPLAPSKQQQQIPNRPFVRPRRSGSWVNRWR